jgi:hypothetical protein
MKTVAANAGIGQVFWQGEHLRQLWVSMMKASVEAGDLRDVGHAFENGFNGSKIVRLMQWRERDELLKIVEHLAVYAHWIKIIRSPVDHAMADTDEPHLPAMAAQKCGEVLDGSCVPKFDAFIPTLFVDDRPVAAFCGEMGRGVESFDLTPKRQIQFSVASGKDGEFDAGRAGVEDKDGRNHVSSDEGQDSAFPSAFSRMRRCAGDER